MRWWRLRGGRNVIDERAARLQRNYEPETRAAAWCANDADLSVHGGNCCLADRQTKTRATETASGIVDLRESLEEAVNIGSINARTGVAHLTAEAFDRRCAFIPTHRQRDRPVFRKLQGIAQKIDHHLP